MVSFQAVLSSKTLSHHNKTISYLDTFPSHPNFPISNSKKRKWDETDQPNDHDNKSIAAFSSSTVDLHLESPLPSEWQRFLDIQSGEIHFYNTRTKKRTVKDPRDGEDTHDQTPSTNMSLDLELNLPCGDRLKGRPPTPIRNKRPNNSVEFGTLSLFSSSSGSPSGVVVVDDKEKQDEMVAAACKRCHMLVVLCKSSPACPNCKFINPPDNPTPTPKLFKPRLSLIC